MRSPINALVTEKALRLISEAENEALLERAIADSTEDEPMVWPIKNVCTKVSVELSDRINHIVGLLDLSKRQFCQAAFMEACTKAERIIEQEGVNEYLEHRAEYEAIRKQLRETSGSAA